MARFPKYVSVAEKKERNERKIKTLKKKNKKIEPIQVKGRKIAKTWWGEAWNNNLEIYADYSNRLSRGRSYVRQGAIADLKIDDGSVRALVIGSGRKPYTIEITVDPLEKQKYNRLIKKIEGKLSSLEDLLQGKFPKALEELFTSSESNLFPNEDEIHLYCDCPDYATMCKHVVATLYGVGAKFDEDPLLFFKLRNIQVEDLISNTIEETSKKLMEHSKNKTERIIEDSDVMGIFDIDLDN
jgi:uncharacterized Zn finger protein